jgi:two-component system cell cycle response regulator
MVTALDQPADRVRGLEAGADDFLTKPVSDIALISRVKSLVRLKMLTDELRSRAETSRDMGIEDPFEEAARVSGENGRVLIVDDRIGSSNRMLKALKKRHQVFVEQRPQEALFRVADEEFDLAIVSLGLEDFDGLRLCSQIRSLERTRQMPLLVAVDPDEDSRLMRALELGVNDYIMRPIDPNELVARVATQVRRRRYSERLRDNVQMSVAMAVTDALTGLHNRRYFDSHIKTLTQHCVGRNRPLSMLLLDIDHFKSVNDTHGHDAGDEVLKEFAKAHAASGPRRRSCLPSGRGGVRRRHAGDSDPARRWRWASGFATQWRAKPSPIHQGREQISVTVSIGASHLVGQRRYARCPGQAG